MRRNILTQKTSVPGHCLFKASVNILQSLGFVIQVEKLVQPTKEILLLLKPVKDLSGYITFARVGSKTVATWKMERFVMIVYGWKPLTINTKRSILDVAGVLIRLCLLRAKFGGAHYKRSEISETTKNVESAKLHILRDLVPRALLALMPYVPDDLCALVRHVPCSLRTLLPHVHHILHVLLLATMICNLYLWNVIKMWFISYISFQDTLIYVNLTILIHQTKFIRKPALRRAWHMELRHFYFHNFNTLYPLKNKN